jgi:hypothetical protein
VKPRQKPGKGQKGAVLITLIVSILVMGVAAGGMLSYSTTASYGELLANRQQRAYYIGETGINYARYLFDPNTNYTNGPFPTPQTFTLSNGQFTVKTYDKAGDPTRLVIESTGAVESGWLTTRQLVTKEISKQDVAGSTTIVDPSTGEVIPIAFNAVDPTAEELDDTWTPVATSEGDVIVTEEGTLEFKGDQGAINLNPELMDFPTAVENNGGVLGYFLQVKIDISKMSPGNYYMIGISFRVQDAGALNSYGISFYRSNGTNGPSWYRSSSFSGIKNTLSTDGTVYAVLWKKVGGVFTLLASAPVHPTYGLLDYVSNKWILTQWAALIIRVNEKDVDGDHRNYIHAYVQRPPAYPLGTINWNFNNFKQVTWTYLNTSAVDAESSSTQVVDRTFTSENFTADRPEIGVHAFYDSFAKDAQLFADFSTTIQGMGSGGSQW